MGDSFDGGAGLFLDMYERISLARKQGGFSKSELARVLGVTPTSCNSWELPPNHRNSSRPSVANLAKLASVLNVRFEWLATGRGDVHARPLEWPSVRGREDGVEAVDPVTRVDGLSPDERRLLDIYLRLSASQRKLLLTFVRMVGAR